MTPYPYPGLRPFKREESDIFFGREQHVDQLLGKLGQHHFLAVVGTSGSGKSSLVKAGMLPALEAGFLAQAGAHWYVADLRPGHRPMWALAESLLGSQAFGPARGNAMESLALLHATLRRGPLGLVEAMRETPLPERANLLVLVDQFEEIFRYRRDIDSQEADAFVALLVASARQREVNVYVALTMRSDFLGDCAVFLDLPETINESQFLAPRLARDQRAAAITEPARVFGGDVEPGLVNQMLNDMGADPDQLPLMQHALMRMWDLASRGGGSTPLPPSQPSVGQGEGAGKANAEASEATDFESAQSVGGNDRAEVLLTSEHYRNVGGFSKALSSHADEALAELTDEREKPVAERIFKRLTKREEGERDTRDPTTLRELVDITETPVDEVIRVIHVFSQPGRSFLTPHLARAPTPALDTIIDISHESLIRQWETLKNWAIDEARSADTYLRLEETARLYRAKNADPYRGLDLQGALVWRKAEGPTDAWAKRYGAKGKETEAFEGAMAFLEESAKNWNEEQASQERRRRKEWIGAGVMFVLAVTAGVYSSVQWQNAEQQKQHAEQQTQSAEQQRQRAAEQTSRAEEHKIALLNAVWKLTSVIRREREQLKPSTEKKLMDLLGENVELLNKITEQKGETAPALRTRSVTWTAIGDIRLESDVVKAEEAYRAGLEIDKRLVRLDPSKQHQRDLSVSYNKIGRALYKQKNRLPEALENYQKGLDIRKRLVEEGGTEGEWIGQQRDLAFNYRKIAEVNEALDNVSAARAAAKQARVIHQELLDKCKERCAQDRRRLKDMDAKIDAIEEPLAAKEGPNR
jgi:tetratricopeptide (TPR) repeat protein